MGLLCFQDNNVARTAFASISRGNLQSPKPRELQHSQLDYLYILKFWRKNLGHGRSHHQYIDNLTTGSIWVEVDLVIGRSVALQHAGRKRGKRGPSFGNSQITGNPEGERPETDFSFPINSASYLVLFNLEFQVNIAT